jgi:Txe/YoeB family toxin of Txe-Axe toxin-antitoxin module
MDWNPDNWLVSRRVETPDIVADIAQHIDNSFTRDAFARMESVDQKKLTVLAERLEFIEHLSAVSQIMQKHKSITFEETPLGNGTIRRIEKYSTIISGHEFAGFDFDADALIIYLLLTCIDTVKGQPKHTNAFKWLKIRCPTGCVANWDALSEEYERDYGLSRLFKEAFTVDCCKEIQNTLVQNLAVAKIASRCIKNISAEAWDKRSAPEKVQRIASEFYSIRSQFTHASFRSFSPDIPVGRSLDAQGTVLLQRVGGLPLRTMLWNVVKHLAVKLVIGGNRCQAAEKVS